MDQNQLTALAREYAEEVYKGIEDERIRKPMVDSLAKGTEDSFHFLLRRYALVEKEKLRAIRWRKVYSAEDIRSKFTEECLIDALFPDLVKEVAS